MIKKPSSSSRFEGGNRPQRMGGAGTRHRMDLFFAAVAQLVERRPEEPGVGGSNPSCGTTSSTSLAQLDFRAPAYEAGGRTFKSCRGCQFLFLGVAQLVARVLWEHEVVRSRRTTETTHFTEAMAEWFRHEIANLDTRVRFTLASPDISASAQRCGRSSMAEPRFVVPLTSVRLRPVTPLRIGNQQHPSWRKWQTQRSQKPWPTGMPVRPGPRGPITKEKTMKHRNAAQANFSFRGDEQASQRLPF